MPLREYQCKWCYNSFDELFNGDYPKNLPCPVCKGTADYHIAPASFKFGFWYGWDAGAGKEFDSDRQRNNYLAENGLEKVPDGVHDQAFGEKVKEQ